MQPNAYSTLDGQSGLAEDVPQSSVSNSKAKVAMTGWIEWNHGNKELFENATPYMDNLTLHYADLGDVQQGKPLPGKASVWVKN